MLLFMENYSNDEIIKAFRDSDSKVLKNIYTIHYPTIRKLVLSNNGNVSEVEDLLSDALTAFLIKLNEDEAFVLTCSFSTFIYTICQNMWLNKLRFKKNYQEILCDTNKYSNTLAEELDIEEFIKDTKKHILYLRHFSKISELCQKVIQMFLDKISLSQIAIITGVTEGYAKSRNYYCKKILINNIMSDVEFKEISYNL